MSENLKTKLWDIANTLRGKMGADDFRDYILGFIFYKYLSEKMHGYADAILKPDGLRYDELDERTPKGQQYLTAVKDMALESVGFFLKPSELFSEMVRRSGGEGEENFILEDLKTVLNNITNSTVGTESEEDFQNLFEDLDLTSSKLGKTTDDKNALIVKVLVHLNQIDFQIDNSETDVLGDAYEYLIGQFASGAGKKAGEFYTPQEVSTVLAKLVTTGKKRLKSVYDPTCGSGSLLLRVAKEVLDAGKFYGQESNPTTYNLARMNMIMHNVHYRKFDIKNEDTLERPQHVEERFEAVVANPPFSAQWSANPLHMNSPRFAAYGRLAPGSKADFAFVQHMVHQLADDGTMACVLPHGVLFRGGAEGHIRQFLIDDRNYLDAVIGLPANIFFGTSIPTCILVLKKNRSQRVTLSDSEGIVSKGADRSNNILFIDASQHYEKVKTQNKLRLADIAKITDTYASYCHSERSEESQVLEEKYAYIATLEEVRDNDYNLNIPRYVDTFEEEAAIDLQAISTELRQVAEALKSTDATIARYCEELGIEAPV
ncbi:MAG: type I restriction-modification system subunit M [Flavobacteriales bacterium]|nr:type I restriction-modification system subunit M [Flavobacteriales bacterium]